MSNQQSKKTVSYYANKASRRTQKPADTTAVWPNCSLRQIREAYPDITLALVASFAGVSVPTMINIEAGAEVKLGVALKIAEFFETTIDRIWPLDNPPVKSSCSEAKLRAITPNLEKAQAVRRKNIEARRAEKARAAQAQAGQTQAAPPIQPSTAAAAPQSMPPERDANPHELRPADYRHWHPVMTGPFGMRVNENGR